MIRYATAVLAALTVWTAVAYAGEAAVTRVRGSSLAVDKGADDGLVIGMTVQIVRPPTESIIHPVTGENLGSPEIEIGMGQVSKVSARAASIRLAGGALTAPRPGDLIRFSTVEEELLREQERASQIKDEAAKERDALRGQASRLTRDVRNIQGTIRTLEKMMKRLERVDDAIKVQLRGVHDDMIGLKEEVRQLRETVALMGAVPIDDIGEDGPPDEEEIARMRALIQEELNNLRGQVPAPDSAPVDEAPPLPDDLPPEDAPLPMEDMEPIEEEAPFYQQIWFYGIFIVLGLAGVAYYLYMRMMGGAEEDEELEEDEDMEEDEDDDELEIEDEEEDDIVVEETN